MKPIEEMSVEECEAEVKGQKLQCRYVLNCSGVRKPYTVYISQKLYESPMKGTQLEAYRAAVGWLRRNT